MNLIARALIPAGLLMLTACGEPPADSRAPASAAQPSAFPAAAPPETTTPFPPPASETPSAAAGSSADDVEAIRAAGAAKDAAYGASNANGVVAVFENDAVLMPPAAAIARGRLPIRQFLAGDMSEMSASGYATVIAEDSVEITVSGSFAFRSGTYSTSDKSGTTVDTGKWLEVWHKTGGQWRIARSIWNSDSLPLLPNMPEPPEEQNSAAE